MKKGILFDLDGTLWDSAEGVARAWNAALEEEGRPERVTVESVHGLMGKTMDAIARQMFPREPSSVAEALLEKCILLENEYLEKHGGVLYAGLEDTLSELKRRGYFLSVVSNCQEGYIEAFAGYHGLEKWFDDTECFGHTRQGKGANIRAVCERNGLEAALYLGDTAGDMEAAGEAGIPFVHAAYGFGIVPEGTPRIGDIRELPGMAKKILG